MLRASLLYLLAGAALVASPAGALPMALDERGLPITATTTETIQSTITSTVYTTLAGATATAISDINPPALTSTPVAPTSLSSSPTTTASSSTSSSSSSAALPVPTLTPLPTGSSPQLHAYYPSWISGQLAPENIAWSKFDSITFAFAVIDDNLQLGFDGDTNAPVLLKRLVAAGHAAGKRVKLSIGGWMGSQRFSSAVATSSARGQLVQQCVAAFATYGIDGIDIDWEYPGIQGYYLNEVSPQDSSNYLLFLQALRAALPNAEISGAVQVWPFAGANSKPMSDVSAFAAVMDSVTLMVYDIWGSSASPGPNAPLRDGCGDSSQPLANAYAAVNSWVNAGFPANKLILGVAAYGYISQSTATSLVHRRGLPEGNHRRSRANRRQSVTLLNANGQADDGQINFSEIVRQGGLTYDQGSKKFVGAGGFTRFWDACSSTPFLRSPSSGQVITYDDPDSLSLKAQFLAQAGLAGANIWEISGDVSDWSLASSLRSGMGI